MRQTRQSQRNQRGSDLPTSVEYCVLCYVIWSMRLTSHSQDSIVVANGLVPVRHHDDAGFCTAVGLCQLDLDLISSTCILSNVVSRRRTCRENDAPRRENFAVLDFSSMPSSLAVLVLLKFTRVAAVMIVNGPRLDELWKVSVLRISMGYGTM